MWHSFEKYSDLCDLINEIFKTGNWGVTFSMASMQEQNSASKDVA